MRWRVLLLVWGWQLLGGRCPHCGWPKLAVLRRGIMWNIRIGGRDVNE